MKKLAYEAPELEITLVETDIITFSQFETDFNTGEEITLPEE